MATCSAEDLFLCVVVPAYNEKENLEQLVVRTTTALQHLEQPWELIIINDGSTDGTEEELERLACDHPRLRPLHLTSNCGQSAALDAGFSQAKGELIAVLDADLQTFPEDLPMMLELLDTEQVDAVVGIRAQRHDSGWKKVSSRVANWVRNYITREEIVDTGCPIKIFKTRALRHIKMFTGMHRFLPTLVRLEGFRVHQVVVRHTHRAAGTSKYGTWDRALPALLDAFAVRWMQNRHVAWRLRER